MPVNEADILSRLNLGTTKAILNEEPNSPLGVLLSGLMQDVTNQLTKSLEKYGAGEGNLRQSITPTKVAIEDSAISVAIQADFYWKFVNYGVNGTEVSHNAPAWGTQPSSGKTFLQSIGEWRMQKGITLPEQFSSYESFDFAIMKNIQKNGKAPRPFFTDVVNEKLVAYLKKPIEKLLKKTIEIQIVEPWQ